MKPASLTLRQRAWLAVLRLAFRRLRLNEPVMPDGIPGIRSVDFPCPGYAPRARQLGDYRDCNTDGHYMCAECAHRAPEPVMEQEGPWRS